MGKPLFSVIAPMYNVERFLAECIESIQAQTLKDIEIILVDDGSPDHCGEIAERYACEDKRIRVVHRSNGGLGPARNSGLEVARGEYVGFVDSDDWIEPEMCEKLYDAARKTKSQIVFSGMKTISHGKTVRVIEHPYKGQTFRGGKEIFQVRRSFYGAPAKKINDDPVPISACVGCYDRLFLERNSLRFRNVRSEDKFFNTEACRAANTVTCISGTPYCYRKEDQPSISHTFKRGTMDSFFRLFRLLGQMADEEPDEFWDESHERADRCVIDYSRVLIRMVETSSLDEAEKTGYVKEVCDHPVLKRACKRFPFWRLPAKQAAFCFCLRMRAGKLARAMTRAREAAR